MRRIFGKAGSLVSGAAVAGGFEQRGVGWVGFQVVHFPMGVFYFGIFWRGSVLIYLDIDMAVDMAFS